MAFSFSCQSVKVVKGISKLCKVMKRVYLEGESWLFVLALLLTGCDIDLLSLPLEALKSFSLKWEISRDI